MFSFSERTSITSSHYAQTCTQASTHSGTSSGALRREAAALCLLFPIAVWMLQKEKNRILPRCQSFHRLCYIFYRRLSIHLIDAETMVIPLLMIVFASSWIYFVSYAPQQFFTESLFNN